jgi:DNA repair protein RadC
MTKGNHSTNGRIRASRETEGQRLDDARVLADLLAPSLGQVRAYRLARGSLERAGNLRALLAEPPDVLAGWPGWDSAHAQALASILPIARRQLEQELLRGDALTSPSDVLGFLRSRLRDRRREVFCGLFLDTRHRVVHWEELFLGSIDGACVYPRIVAEKALLLGAAAVIVAHNHPSGVCEPSIADQAITRRLKDALALLEIRLLDHFVIGEGMPVSLASRGLL